MLTQGEANAGIHARRLKSGDALAGVEFPLYPFDGQQFYRTDLVGTFYYDGSRSKWLSVRAVEVDFSIASALGAAGYWNLPGAGVSSATFGHVAAFDMTCTGVSFCFEATPGSFNIVLRQNGTVTGAGIVTGGAQSGSDTAVNVDFDEGDIIGCRSSNATPTGSGHVRAVFRRRAS